MIARSDWQRHEVTAALRGSYTAYDKTPELDRPSVDGKITGRFDVTRNTALIGEGTLIVGTDNPGSPNVQAGLHALPDLHDARRHRRHHAALQPRRGHRQGLGGAHRIPAVGIHRRHDREQRRPRLQSLRRLAAHQLRPDAGAQALRRSHRRYAPARSRVRPLRPAARLGRLDRSRGGSTFAYLAQAHRRDRDRLDQPQIRRPVLAGAATASCSTPR